MRDDQYLKLKALNEKLVDLFLKEADPDKWPGAGIEPADQSKDDRGNAYWCKKNASGTISLVQRIYTLTGMVEHYSKTGDTGDIDADDMDVQMAAAEKEAKKMIERAFKSNVKT